jgi:hypothetical protein
MQMQLNNYFQVCGGNRRLEWRFWSEGPDHSRVWHAIFYSTSELLPFLFSFFNKLAVCAVDGIAFGEGSGHTKEQAREAAAQTTLAALQATTQNTASMLVFLLYRKADQSLFQGSSGTL